MARRGHPALRSARRDIKAMPDAAQDDIAALRKDVAALELRAEQIGQAMLYRLVPTLGEPAASPPRSAIRHNIAVLLARARKDCSATDRSRIRAVVWQNRTEAERVRHRSRREHAYGKRSAWKNADAAARDPGVCGRRAGRRRRAGTGLSGAADPGDRAVRGRQRQRRRHAASCSTGWARRSASRSSSTTARAPAATPARRLRRGPRPTATRW